MRIVLTPTKEETIIGANAVVSNMPLDLSKVSIHHHKNIQHVYELVQKIISLPPDIREEIYKLVEEAHIKTEKKSSDI